jgi:hypothetical protein
MSQHDFMHLTRPGDHIVDHWRAVPPAPWLRAVADSVGAMVCDRFVMARFRALVRRWRREYRPTPGGLTLLPHRPLSLPEQVALLAAIHDALNWGRPRIDP